MRTSEDARRLSNKHFRTQKLSGMRQQLCHRTHRLRIAPLRQIQRRATSAKDGNIVRLRGNFPRHLQHSSKQAVLESDLMHENSEHVQPNQY